MSRKNPFAAIDLASLGTEVAPAVKAGYGMTGAAKTVVRSVEEMAENTKRLMDGEVIVELDPMLLDSSFVADRLSADDQDYRDLKAAIHQHGQTTPILVRPNPENEQRYMVVFGHRRAQAARDLGLKVKAVIKQLDDMAHAIAQGQENSARSNLSFIERAYFAQNLLINRMSKDIVKSAIGIDDAMLSKMLSVIEAIPEDIMTALGASKGIGRDKWLSLRQIVLNPAYKDVARQHILKPEFSEVPDDRRFDELLNFLKRYRAKSTAKTPRSAKVSTSWTSSDNSMSVSMNRQAKKVAIELSNVEARPFSDWLTTNLDRLYDEYRNSKNS
ncbi:plasmid partitioning protein RepB [Mesorhizobium sp. SP-1A]|uniref:plasmid partitioning protein RepB n=1 Tax=Mesorhizobium sp. SP-1A TaxID=3077840 RepID=UPI0028F731B8|nr:plasmid partitioning protein RepB [Mesorhizobium sp. SP-1A]